MGDSILYNQMQLNEQNISKGWKKHGIIQVSVKEAKKIIVLGYM